MLLQTAALFVRSFSEVKLVNHGVDYIVAKDVGAAIGFIALAIMMLPLLRIHGDAIRVALGRPVDLWRTCSNAAIVGVLLWVASVIALIALRAGIAGIPDPAPEAGPLYIALACHPHRTFFLSLLVLCALTPLIEESINRGLILPCLLQYGSLFAITVSALLFALLHRPDTYLVAFVFGVFVALQRLRFASLWPGICSHATFNALVLTDAVCLDIRWHYNSFMHAVGTTQFALLASMIVCLAVAARLTWHRGPARTD